jgi:hypothetical protein
MLAIPLPYPDLPHPFALTVRQGLSSTPIVSHFLHFNTATHLFDSDLKNIPHAGAPSNPLFHTLINWSPERGSDLRAHPSLPQLFQLFTKLPLLLSRRRLLSKTE